MAGVDYWLEDGTHDEMNLTVRSMLKFKFDHRRERSLPSYGARESAAMLLPYHLFRVIDAERGIGELILPADA